MTDDRKSLLIHVRSSEEKINSTPAGDNGADFSVYVALRIGEVIWREAEIVIPRVAG
jgi:hypothetical protein